MSAITCSQASALATGLVAPGELLPAGIGPARAFDPTWCLVADPDDDLVRVNESLLCLADGVIGTRGVLEERPEAEGPAVAASGLYEPSEGTTERLLAVPPWCSLPVGSLAPGRRVLDLRDGVLVRRVADGSRALCTVRFACAARPGTAVLAAEVDPGFLSGDERPGRWATSILQRRSPAGGGVVVAIDTRMERGEHSSSAGSTAHTPGGGPGEHAFRQPVLIARLAGHAVSPRRPPRPARAARQLARARELGPQALLAEQRATWEGRWAEAEIEVLGDPVATFAARFALFHVLSSARHHGEAPVGARGLTGSAYAGHVFWDTEAFVLPVLAAIDRQAARTVLEYRIRRLPQARALAASGGRNGARFPWESAAVGTDVTPSYGIDHCGELVPIRTGTLEEHVTADVAWAAWRYATWRGDWSFLDGPGRPLVVDTARYWASRLCWDTAGRAHIDQVTGPDEYHERVDDNAFTNVMARWNLRRAAELVEREGAATGDGDEAQAWRSAADALVDNYDPSTGRYEQFSGYDRLEPLLAADLGTPPLAADLVLGSERLAQSQVIKQADVLMAHLLVPEETAPGSLGLNLDHYLPRTSHGSSLSPAVHATLLARAGRPDEALRLWHLAAKIDLEDLTETTAGGLHLANLGGIWQAVVHGFAGVSLASPDDRVLGLAPALPSEWAELRLRLRWRGRRLRLVCRDTAVHVGCDRSVTVALYGEQARVDPPGRWVG